MIKLKYFLGLLLILFLYAFKSPDEKETKHFYIGEFHNCYAVDSTKYVQQFIEIRNESNENIWILFEKDLKKDNKDIINSRFRHRWQGDMTLFQWITDGNVLWNNYCIELYSTFFKILPPDQTFLIIKCDANDCNIAKIKECIRVITSDELRKIFVPLTYLESTVKPSYQPNSLIIP